MELDRKSHGASKRKQSPEAVLERPAKQLRPQNFSFVDGGSPALHTRPSKSISAPIPYEDMDSEEEEVVLPLPAAAADTAEWQATIQQVVESVVSIHFCQTCSFDTDSALMSQATGFVVDAERGYILTNRHVVSSGPFWGYCVFYDHEEVSQDRTFMQPESHSQ